MAGTTLGNTVGAMLLGTLASAILYGAIIVQGYLYFSRYRQDRWLQKIAVGTLIILPTLNTVFGIKTVHYYLVEKFGDVEALSKVAWSFKFQQVWDILTVIVVQSLYALRVWKLSRHVYKIWPIIIALIVAGGSASGLALLVEVYRMDTWAEITAMKTTVNISLAVVVLTDIVIASTICYSLQQSRSGFSSTNNTLVKIMQYVLACGFLTSACSLSALIMFSAMPNSLVFASIDFLLARLYVNSYLALLNARKSIKGESDGSFSNSRVFHLQTRQGQTQTSQFGTDDENGKATGIHLVEQPKIDIAVHHVVDRKSDSVPTGPHLARNV